MYKTVGMERSKEKQNQKNIKWKVSRLAESFTPGPYYSQLQFTVETLGSWASNWEHAVISFVLCNIFVTFIIPCY